MVWLMLIALAVNTAGIQQRLSVIIKKPFLEYSKGLRDWIFCDLTNGVGVRQA